MRNHHVQSGERRAESGKEAGKRWAHSPLSARPLAAPRGFTLLLATLTATLLLILGATIFNLIRKEVILSSLGRDSQYAFYAADTAAECALFWDVRYGIFTTTTPFADARCDEQPVGTIVFPGYGNSVSLEYEPNGFCARVTVTKNASDPFTVIDARGYNTRCAQIENNPRALERAVEITY